MWPFRSKKFKSFLNKEWKHKIIPAFEHNGIKYYQFENAFDIPTGRGLQAWTIYEELNMRVDRDYLEKHIRAVEIILNSQKIKITDLALIHANLKERLHLVPFPDHIYKLASVMFFDETESPFSYDPAYNEKKIAAWRTDPEMLPFLAKVPLNNLTRLTDITDENLKTYFVVANAMDQMHQKEISEILSRNR